MTGDSLQNLRIRVVPGSGLVAVQGEVLLVVPSIATGQEHALEGLLAAAGSAAPERAVARVVADHDDDRVPPFCLVAPGEVGGLFALVHGELELSAEGPEGGARLRGREARTWVDRMLPGGLERLAVTTPDNVDPEPDPFVDLRSGVVRGAGVLVTRREDAVAGDAPSGGVTASATSTQDDTPVRDTPNFGSDAPMTVPDLPAPGGDAPIAPSGDLPRRGGDEPRSRAGFRPEPIRFGQGGRMESMAARPLNGHDGHGHGRRAAPAATATAEPETADAGVTVVDLTAVEAREAAEAARAAEAAELPAARAAEPEPAVEALAEPPATDAAADVAEDAATPEVAEEAPEEAPEVTPAEDAVTEAPAGAPATEAVATEAAEDAEDEDEDGTGHGTEDGTDPGTAPEALSGGLPGAGTGGAGIGGAGIGGAGIGGAPGPKPQLASALLRASSPASPSPAFGASALDEAREQARQRARELAASASRDAVEPPTLKPFGADRGAEALLPPAEPPLVPPPLPAAVAPPVAPPAPAAPFADPDDEVPFFARTQVVPPPSAGRGLGVVPPPPVTVDPFAAPAPLPPAPAAPEELMSEPAAPQAQRGRLVIDNAPDVLVDMDCVIGRNPEVDPEVAQGRARAVVLPDAEQRISRVHARIVLTGSGVDIVDAGSVNGTWIEPPGAVGWIAMVPRVPAPLPLGSRIQVGDLVLSYEPAVPA